MSFVVMSKELEINGGGDCAISEECRRSEAIKLMYSLN